MLIPRREGRSSSLLVLRSAGFDAEDPEDLAASILSVAAICAGVRFFLGLELRAAFDFLGLGCDAAGAVEPRFAASIRFVAAICAGVRFFFAADFFALLFEGVWLAEGFEELLDFCD